MHKKIIICVIIVAVLLGVFVPKNQLFTNELKAEEFRNGFIVEPESSDKTGVKPDSKFLIKTEQEITREDLVKILSIEGEPLPEITAKGDKLFEVTLNKVLEQNKVYFFKIKPEGKEEITWAFQTSAAFRVTGVFPADKSTNVPVNTGIELYFSHEDYENIDNYFEISPKVEGSFERHKLACVFVPEKLENGKLYTIKLKKGLKLAGTKDEIKEDIVFAFETEPTVSQQEDSNKGFFSYTRMMNEYTPGEKPYIPINYYLNNNKTKEVNVQTNIYNYKNLDAFKKALGQRDKIPSWAYFSSKINKLPTEGLEKVLSFEESFSKNPTNDEYIKLPQALPEGFYLVDSHWEDLDFQTLIQVTDIGIYLMRSSTESLVWLNDLSSKKPIVGAKIKIDADNSGEVSDFNGMVVFKTPQEQSVSESQKVRYLEITTKENKTAVVNFDSNYYYNDSISRYWSFLSQDRSLYKPDDTVQFWGLAKSRYQDTTKGTLEVEISQSYNLYGDFGGKSPVGIRYLPNFDEPLVRMTVPVENGVFKGALKLPSIDPGSYQLLIKSGDEVIINSYINVQNYIKPAYKIDISKDKKAVFPGQSVDIKFKAAFFEGTGLPDLKIQYNINPGSGLAAINGNKTTDGDGNIDIKYTPADTAQGESSTGIFCNATLPEAGDISQNDSLRVFVNDINVNISTDVKKSKKYIFADVKKIVLDRLNNGTAKDMWDYLGEPVEGKEFHGTVYKNTWVKVENGQYYDFINKVTEKRYKYDLHTEAYSNFDFISDKDGKASCELEAPDFDGGYYSAKLSCKDTNGRTMNFETYIGQAYNYSDYDENRFYLDGGKDKYKLGETADLTYKNGKNVLPDSKFLFIKTQNGIREYKISSKPEYKFDFSQKDAPNVNVTGVYFNGNTYIESETLNAIYDFGEKNLVLEAKTDKASYKPGEEVTVKVWAKDSSGKTQKAVVNASLVDEALFKLQDQNFDTLGALYTQVPSGINFTYASHLCGETSRNLYYGHSDVKAIRVTFSEAISANSLLFDKAAYVTNNKDEVAIRQDFKDTAFFDTKSLDEKGYGEFKFKLPDNITSWRVTLSGVTSDLLGGSNKVNLNVTLPFFINYSFNTSYLAGDTPVVGVNAYGSELKEKEPVYFEVTSKTDGTKKVTASGTAFERVNIPLWKLDAGDDSLIIRAYTNEGLSDSLEAKFKVVSTYNLYQQAVYSDLNKGMKLEGGTSGNTRLVFSDKGRGQFLPLLTNLMYTSGNRIDQKLTSKLASELMSKYFKEDVGELEDRSFDEKAYQKSDGGIALLPYGESDPQLTAKLTPLIKDKLNEARLKQYFYSLLYGDKPGIKASSLYGLAALHEPVLQEVKKASMINYMSLKDSLYLALAYCQFGETFEAQKLYKDKIKSNLQELKPFVRLNTGKDQDDILECTALAAVLAAKLDRPEKTGLFDYCLNNSTKDILNNIEMLSYISSEIEKSSTQKSKFTYSYEGKTVTKEIRNGETFALVIPSLNLTGFKINEVSGAISVTSLFEKELSSSIKPDPNLSVTRKYFVVNGQRGETKSFKENDIVRVELMWDIAEKALDGGYEITDYLPSGMKAIQSPVNDGINGFREGPAISINDQKVTIDVYKDTHSHKTATYYARIITPGKYKADKAIMQAVASKDSYSFSKEDFVEIK